MSNLTGIAARRLAILGVLVAPCCSKSAPTPPPPAASANPGKSSAALDVPRMAPHVLATLEQTHVRRRFVPESDASLGYELLVPKDWAFSKPSGSAAADGTVALGSVTGPPAIGSPTIVISVATPGFEVPIDAWLRGVFSHAKYTITSAKWFPGAKGLFFDATGTRANQGAEEVRRTSVRVDGRHIFAVTCLVPRNHWDEAKESCWAAHDTFALLKGTGEAQLETWLTAVGKAPDFVMAHPASWSATPVASPPPGISAMDVRLVKDKDTLLAYVQVKVELLAHGAPIASLEQLRDKSLEKLKGIGFVAGGPLSRLTENDDPRSMAVAGWLGGFVGDGRTSGSTGSGDATARLGFVRRDSHLVTFLVLSPTAHDDTMVALRAQRAFEIARATLRVD